jgi:hypothetical protein
MEQWSTLEEIGAVRERFAATISGWQPPEAHGLALIPSGADAAPEHFAQVNTKDHQLPAVVAATVIGYSSGTRVIELDRAALQAIVEKLSPAEACPIPHPNLWAWRDRYLPALDADPSARLVYVFVGDLDDPMAGPEDAAFREALRQALARKAAS